MRITLLVRSSGKRSSSALMIFTSLRTAGILRRECCIRLYKIWLNLQLCIFSCRAISMGCIYWDDDRRESPSKKLLVKGQKMYI